MAIKFNDVAYYYEKPKRKKIVEPAIKDINLSFNNEPEFVMIVGKTGSGKSTLLSHINGLLLPTSGNLDVEGYRLTPNKFKNPKLKDVRKKIGYVFQFPEYQLFEESVLKDITYGPKNFGYSEEESIKRAKEVANRLNITDILEMSPFEISGGQMRKAAIAGIVAYGPDIYLLDEPTRGLDPLGAKEVMDFFYNLYLEGKTIIMITHDMDLLYQYATRVIVLSDGIVSFDGKKEELFKEEYKKYGLAKPMILNIIDTLNDKLGFKLTYNIYNDKDLLEELKKNERI